MLYGSLLVVDDEEINREIMGSFFEEDMNVLFAENGEEALKILDEDKTITAVLLDIYMPGMSGLDVLKAMNERGLIKKLPVFVVTAATDSETLSQAYDLGADDVIGKAQNPRFTRRRVLNTIELYRVRDNLQAEVERQVEKLSTNGISMVYGLASAIEFRDGESGEHVKRMSRLTGRLLECIREMFPEYGITSDMIPRIVTASVLHDIGKIAIPDSVLKKNGRLTDEEFEIMRGHTIKGEELLNAVPDILDEELSGYCKDICRHHHERWDGKGYPDKLKGDEISIWAQAASLADVYDALTSPRCYKPSFTPEKAKQMIENGECGIFNPKLLQAFDNVYNEISK